MELDCNRKTYCCQAALPFSNCSKSLLASQSDDSFKIPDVPRPGAAGQQIEDWAEEVRPSMRKLRQGMDSLLKTTRMMCSVLRLQQLEDAVRLTAEVKHRRDVCFSQALTSLVTGLMSRLWCRPPCPVFLSVLTQIGPLVCFEGLLSMHGEDVTIYNDMIVAIEDLRSVEFNLVKVEGGREEAGVVPSVRGSRSSLKVMIPLPTWASRPQGLQYIKELSLSHSLTFSVLNRGVNFGSNIDLNSNFDVYIPMNSFELDQNAGEWLTLHLKIALFG